ncbi:MAG: hypothetical protein ACPGSE_00475 [Synechococcus sp.]
MRRRSWSVTRRHDGERGWWVYIPFLGNVCWQGSPDGDGFRTQEEAQAAADRMNA